MQEMRSGRLGNIQLLHSPLAQLQRKHFFIREVQKKNDVCLCLSVPTIHDPNQ
jgi:hypothetical protein